MSISQTDAYGVQVRVKRNGKLFSRYFAFRAHGGKRSTLAAARRHEAKLARLPRLVVASAATSRNRTTRIRGVSLSSYRSRAKGRKVYEYKVSYTAPGSGRRKVKTFYVGTAETFTKARAAAVLRRAVRFRAAYVRGIVRSRRGKAKAG
jgi:hypothetical protein